MKASQLGAVIDPAHEYVDAGESAKTADRDDLQRMLQDIKTVRPDYVIVHKIDRLARNRADDIAINLLLKKYGVKLVSCTENIDDTPSGRLLYGLMAEIAQFYSGNLALEVMKGSVRKAEEGGTPFRAPLGYLNRKETRGGVEHSWVELDQERADIVRWCFEAYATGEWSGIDLTLAAQSKGLTTRATADKPSKPIGLNTMYHILSNPYYMGVVSFRGIHYEGKHSVLVEPDVWLAVQDLLAAHAHRGEKDRVHPHYLRGTIFCSNCGGRLVYSENTGNGGTYVYYFCVKKKTKENNCTRGAMRLERIEDAIAEFYQEFKLSSSHAEGIRQAVRTELSTQQAESRQSLKRATKRREQAQNERSKLLQAHYAGAIPQDLLASEMNRLTRELATAEGEIKAAKTTNTEVEAVLDAALRAATHCEQAYLTAPEHVKRQINQGFFERLLIGPDGSVERAELTEPFLPILGEDQTAGELVTESDQINTDRTLMHSVSGLKQVRLVDLRGFEPLTPSMRTRCATGLRYRPLWTHRDYHRPGVGLKALFRGGQIGCAVGFWATVLLLPWALPHLLFRRMQLKRHPPEEQVRQGGSRTGPTRPAPPSPGTQPAARWPRCMIRPRVRTAG
jgi:site-specific DNA recombinase